MLDYIKNYLKNEHIDEISCISLDDCDIKRKYLLDRNSISQGSVIIFAVPYLTPLALEKKNVSAYAVSRDYHIFFKSLFDSLLSELKDKFPSNRFAAFSDHSPIDEIKAAARAGLGIIGKNHLLITEKYSSFVFLGEIITDAILPYSPSPIRYCEDCGSCQSSCPVSLDLSLCLSALTQKKGELDDGEKEAIAQRECVWGCDICQTACPHSKNAIKCGSAFTKIKFFSENAMPYITSEQISALSEEEFAKRAYSWRGKDTVLRNLLISEGYKNGDSQKNK